MRPAAGLSAAAVSETVDRLEEQGMVELHEDRSLHLTDSGRRLATSVVRRHRLAERLLHDVIGLEWEKVHKEADRWEHAISEDVEPLPILLDILQVVVYSVASLEPVPN